MIKVYRGILTLAKSYDFLENRLFILPYSVLTKEQKAIIEKLGFVDALF